MREGCRVSEKAPLPTSKDLSYRPLCSQGLLAGPDLLASLVLLISPLVLFGFIVVVRVLLYVGVYNSLCLVPLRVDALNRLGIITARFSSRNIFRVTYTCSASWVLWSSIYVLSLNVAQSSLFYSI
jgi:hypothetical protein